MSLVTSCHTSVTIDLHYRCNWNAAHNMRLHNLTSVT